MAKLVYAYAVGLTVGFLLGARYVYDYHVEQMKKK